MKRKSGDKQILKTLASRQKPVRMSDGGVPKNSPAYIAMHGLSNEGDMRGLGQMFGVSGRFSEMLKKQEEERLAREGGTQSQMRKGGKVNEVGMKRAAKAKADYMKAYNPIYRAAVKAKKK